MGSFYRDIYNVSNDSNKKQNTKPEECSYKWYEIALGYGIIFSAIGALPFLGSNKEYYGVTKKSVRYKK